MARFASLYDAARVIGQQISDGIQDPPLAQGTVMVALPRETPDDTTDQIRISLLWTNEQATHGNDGWQRAADGGERPPPLTLSVFFLVTTHGLTTSNVSLRALQLLGEVLRVFHDAPTLRLPLATLPECGEGELGVRVVPMAPELLEKLFGPLQLRHRPFALLEAGPVQLASAAAPRPPKPVVRPGGTRMEPPDPSVAARPTVTRVLPATQGVGGRIRIDGAFPAIPTRVWVGSVKIEGAAITVLSPEGAVSVRLPTAPQDAAGPGIHNVAVLAGGVPSEALPIRVVEPSVPTLDAPSTLRQSRGAPLVLSGRSLDGAAEVVAWPDAGVQSPSEVLSLTPDAVAPAELTIQPAKLAGLGNRAYRFAVRTGPHQYSPYVVLEVTP